MTLPACLSGKVAVREGRGCQHPGLGGGSVQVPARLQAGCSSRLDLEEDLCGLGEGTCWLSFVMNNSCSCGNKNISNSKWTRSAYISHRETICV